MRATILLGLVASLCLVMTAQRAAAQFSTIINLPPDSLPDRIESHTQINVLPGGALPDQFVLPAPLDVENVEINLVGGKIGVGVRVPWGTETNILSGEVGSTFHAAPSSIVSVSGGTIDRFFTAEDGSDVTVSGGRFAGRFIVESGSAAVVSGGVFGDAFVVEPQSDTTLVGADFRVNGVPVAGLNNINDSQQIELSGEPGTMLSGVFRDGTPFVFTVRQSDLHFRGTSLTLRHAELPPPVPIVLHAATDPLPTGIRAGQTLVVGPGASMPPNFNAAGATILVQGGTTGENLEVLDSNVAILSGAIGSGIDAFGASKVSLLGGLLSGQVELFPDSSLELAGGVWNGSIRSQPGSSIDIRGGEFYLNGTALSGLDVIGSRHEVNWDEGDLVTGVLVDGTPFILSYQEGITTVEAATLPEIGPSLINAATDPIPSGIRAGQTLIVDGGAALPANFRAGRGSVVEVRDGTLGSGFQAVGAEVHIHDGPTGGGVVAIGGRVVIGASELPVGASGWLGAEIEVNGGPVSSILLRSGSNGTVRGGRLGYINVGTDSQLRLVGSDFRANGELIEELNVNGDSLGVDLPTYGTITGILSDGTPFALVRGGQVPGDFIVPGGLILEKAPIPAAEPGLFDALADDVPLGLRDGQTLLVNDGAEVAVNYIAGRGSTVEVQGGSVGRYMTAAGAIVNVRDGRVNVGFDAVNGTIVNMTGGIIDREMSLLNDSVLNLSGGIVGFGLDAFPNTTINMIGGQANGGVDVWDGSVLNMSGGVLGPSVGTTVLTAHPGSTINISAGEILGRVSAMADSTINISGGESIGQISIFPDAVLNLSGGRHQDISGGIVNISGDVQVKSLYSGGELNLTGGYLHWDDPSPFSRQSIRSRGTMRMTGGRTGANADVILDTFSTTSISGGTIAGKLIANSGSNLTVQGTSLRINGELVTQSREPGARIDLNLDPSTSVISGSFADGTPFIYSYHKGDELTAEGPFNHAAQFELVEPTGGRPSLVELPRDPVPLGAGAGQTVVIGPGGEVYPGFQAGWDSTLSVAGGTVGDQLRASGSRVIVESGSIGDGFHAYHGTTVETHGGTIGDDFTAFEGSTVHVLGGEIGDNLVVRDGATAIVRGGSIGNNFRAEWSANVHWYGGDLGEGFEARYFSTLHVYGSEFYLGDHLLDLSLGETMQVPNNRLLTATLSDGLQESIRVGRSVDGLPSAVAVTVTRVSFLPGDFDADGIVRQEDLDLVLLHWGERADQRFTFGWINDLPIELIDQSELDRVLVNWGRTILPGLPTHAVPEPTTMAMLWAMVAGLAAIAIRGRERKRWRPGNGT